MNDKLPLLLVTANVGSLFEDIKHLLPKWCKEMTNKIATLGYPPFVAIHFQEIGGKYPQAAIDGIKQMNKQFLACEDLSDYTTVLGYFDQDFTNEDKYTALGAYFLIHKSLKNVAIWNYNDRRYETMKAGKQIITDCLDSLNTIEKLKYPKEFFPEMKWSRKGYLKTKWKICGIVMNLINIHLFHDPSNLISLRSSPSVYAEYRKHAFEYVLNSLDEDPAFIFGDFNFRLDQCKLLKKLAKQCRVEMNYSDEEKETPIKLTLTEKNSLKARLIVEPSTFKLECPRLFDKNARRLRKLDKEPRAFEKWLFEFPVDFIPSYPFTEDVEITDSIYLEKRCPSWCDRVLLTHSTKEIIIDKKCVRYELNGIETCMGDHKPVSLHLFVAGNESISEEPRDVFVQEKSDVLLETSV